MNRKMTRVLAVLLALLAMTSALAEEPASGTEVVPADPYVELSTPYPAMTVNAGDEITLDLAIDNYSGASQDFASDSGHAGGLVGRFQRRRAAREDRACARWRSGRER